MQRAVTRAGEHDFVIVDGRKIRGFEEHAGPYKAMIDGDARCYAMSCASIVAKVTRDRLMTQAFGALPVVRLGPQRRLCQHPITVPAWPRYGVTRIIAAASSPPSGC